jgi:hypothetical protein
LPPPPPPSPQPDAENFASLAMRERSVLDPAEASLAQKTREVELQPLDDAQIREMASTLGVDSPDALLAAIALRNAWDFARRPQDLIELCDDWRDQRSIRTHREQLASHVRTRLSLDTAASRREPAQLPLARALAGAQRLALATLLTRRLSIRHSAGGALPPAPRLDPKPLLDDFEPREIRTLLQRPLFGVADYGSVRFAHRSVAEYLAAQQIHQLLSSRAMSRRTALRLLLAAAPNGPRLVRPSMAHTAAWLALDQPEVFAALLDAEPSVVLVHGDPESLTPAQRSAALQAFIERYGAGGWIGLRVPALQLQRLAPDPELAEIVETAYADVRNPEVRELLLQLVAAGRYERCRNIAHSVATDDALPERERFHGLLALIALSDGRVPSVLNAMATMSSSWTPMMVRWTVLHLFPEHLDNRLTVALLRRLAHTPTPFDHTDALARTVDEPKVPIERCADLLAPLVKLTREQPPPGPDHALDRGESENNVAVILRSICRRLLDAGRTDRELLSASVLALRCAEGSVRESDNRPLLDAINRLPADARRWVFLADVALLQSSSSLAASGRNVFAAAFFDGPLGLTSELDAAWLIDALGDVNAAPDLRAILLQAAQALASKDVCELENLTQIAQAVADSPALTQALATALAPPPPADPQHDALLLQLDRDHQQRAAGESLRRSKWSAFWEAFDADPAPHLTPDQRGTTLWKLWSVLRQFDDFDNGRWNDGVMHSHFSAVVTARVRAAFRQHWRTMRPPPSLRSERAPADKSIYLQVWNLGAVGIDIEASEPGWASRLTPDEAALAIRYALFSASDLPAWLEALSDSQGQLVDNVIGRELSLELDEPLPQEGRWHSMLLQGLRLALPALARRFVTQLSVWLQQQVSLRNQQARTQPIADRIEQVTGYIVAHGDSADRLMLADIAEGELAAPGTDESATSSWLALLGRVDAPRGIAALIRQLESCPVEPEGAAVRLIGGLLDTHRHLRAFDVSDSAIDPRQLLSLTVQVYRHVTPHNDAPLRGVFTPGPRDYSEDARRIVFDALMQARGPNALQAKLELSQHALFADMQDRIRALARDRLAEEADALQAEPSDMPNLLRGRDLPPRTHADMSRLLVDRLDDLQDLMLDDASPRRAWAAVERETDLRPAVAHQLQMMALGAYSVDQEGVTADEKRTDVRLRSPYGPEAPIELKIGEKWTAAKLFDAVSKQLVALYMAPTDTRTGCLLVTVSNPTHMWKHPDTGHELDGACLQSLLAAAALEAQHRLGGEALVSARVLDLRPRVGTKAATPHRKRRK